MFNSIKTKLASRAYANPNTEQNEHKTAEIHSEQTPKRKRGISTVVAWLIGIGVVVVAGAVVGIILATSASDTQDATSDITERGAFAAYRADCDYSGRPIAYIHNLAAGTTNADTPASTLTTTMLNTEGVFGNLRRTENLSEQVYNADFNADGDINNLIAPAASVAFEGSNSNAGFAPGAGMNNVSIVFVPENQWGNLATSPANLVALNNRLQLFVNSADGCWGIRRV